MHITHKRGAYSAEAEAVPTHRSSPKVLWASVPLQTAAGRLVGMRIIDGALEVAIAGPPALRWIPAERALSEAQARRWASFGFPKRHSEP